MTTREARFHGEPGRNRQLLNDIAKGAIEAARCCFESEKE